MGRAGDWIAQGIAAGKGQLSATGFVGTALSGGGGAQGVSDRRPLVDIATMALRNGIQKSPLGLERLQPPYPRGFWPGYYVAG